MIKRDRGDKGDYGDKGDKVISKTTTPLLPFYAYLLMPLFEPFNKL